MTNIRFAILIGLFIGMCILEIIWSIPSRTIVVERFGVEKVFGVITAYSAESSCHYPGCPNAMGKVPKEGTIACPRHLKLGTIVRIFGKEYECQDRYAKYLDSVRKLPTFDIFMDEGAMEFGKKVAEVEIIKEL